MRFTVATLNKAIDSCGQDGVYFDGETKPTEVSNEGHLMISIDQDLKLQFCCNQSTCCVAPYWSDVKGSREDAIKGLIKDLEDGFEPMCKETAWACGVDL